MKMFALLVISTLSVPSYAQQFLGTLQSHQSGLQSPSRPVDNTSNSGTSTVSTSSGSITNGKCEENDQTSIPLAYISSLIQEKNGKLDILHDPRNGTLSVTSNDMISNCSSMIEWRLQQKTTADKKIYAVEAKIKEGDGCADGVCTYKVAKVENGVFKEFEEMKFKPTLKGFEECLEKSGVIKAGKVVSGAIYGAGVSEKFDGAQQSGELRFVSHGPSSALIKPKYDKFLEIDKCDHYEKISPEGIALFSLEDQERQRILAEKEAIRECGEYEKIADFIERYESYATDLNSIRDQLILDAVKKSAKAISEGKYTDEDLKVIADFEKYIVQPKITLAHNLFNEMDELDGEAKKAKRAELQAVLSEIKALGSAPYLTTQVVQKLEDDGRFVEAEKANDIKAILYHHQSLGSNQSGTIITPEVAMTRTLTSRASYSDELIGKKEKYQIRTGQVDVHNNTQSKAYNNLAAGLRQSIQIRTQNYNEEIMSEYARIQPGGHCYRNAPYRNTQRCIMDTQQRIQELMADLKYDNDQNLQMIQVYEEKAAEYAKLEAEGRRYIAAQNGEPVPEEEATEERDNTRPTPRNDGPQGNPYIYTGGQPQQPNMYMPQQNVNPMAQQNMFNGQNPYQYMGSQQQPYGQQQYGMGQTQQYPSYGYTQQYGMGQQQQYGMGGQYYGQFGFQAGANMGTQQYGYGQQPSMYGGMNGQNPYQYMGGQQGMYGAQQPQQGYWNNPYQAYNMYSMYR